MQTRQARQARSRKGKGESKKKVEDKKEDKKEIPSVDPISTSDEDSLTLECLTCVEEIQYYAKGDGCDHTVLCGKCAIRQRQLYHKPECVLCQAMHSNLLITTNPKQLVKNINFNELPQLPDSQIYFDCENTFEHFNTLFKFSCPKCKAVCQSLKGLQNHLKDKHGFVYCNVCLDFIPKFVCEYEIYTPEDLRKHIKGNPIPGKEYGDDGHPHCNLCREAFFDSETLWLHKYNAHKHCKICVQEDDSYIFFGNYRNLQRHYNQNHYVCTDAVCIAEKNVVFATQLQLQEHNILVHRSTEKLSQSEKKKARTLELDFEFAPPTPNSRNSRHQRGQNGRQNSSNEINTTIQPEIPSNTDNTSDNNTHQLALPRSNEELKSRNRELIKQIKLSLLYEDGFSKFKELNVKYVNGFDLSAEKFHEASIKLFKHDKIHPILMELMALLPDVKKRVDLKKVHEEWYAKNQNQKQNESKNKKKNKNKKNKNTNTNTHNINSKKEESTDNEDETIFTSKIEDKKEDNLRESDEYPSLMGSNFQPPPGLMAANAYGGRIQGKLTDDDFPELERKSTPPSRAIHAASTPTLPSQTNRNSKKKRKPQRKKQVLFTVGI